MTENEKPELTKEEWNLLAELLTLGIQRLGIGAANTDETYQRSLRKFYLLDPNPPEPKKPEADGPQDAEVLPD
jgi:hypothetical protein|tara:strand:+ start:736 stop:954 length:219 start_codon:yes stop_codon:yes gene_type:complete